jgi:salicylate hydroxylase
LSSLSIRAFAYIWPCQQVGAGIQIPPNSTRLLLDWGLEPFLRAHVVEPECIQLRRWKDSSVIGLTKLKPDFRIKYQAPYYLIHRAHFHSALYKLALHHGVKVKVNSKVIEYDEHVPSVTVQGGECFAADLVVAADGVSKVPISLK